MHVGRHNHIYLLLGLALEVVELTVLGLGVVEPQLVPRVPDTVYAMNQLH